MDKKYAVKIIIKLLGPMDMSSYDCKRNQILDKTWRFQKGNIIITYEIKYLNILNEIWDIDR